MAKQLAALLRTNMGLPDLAEQVRKAGRGGDTILAHINPREVELLKRHGGSGKINPRTGLPEFKIDPNTGEDDGTGEDNIAQKEATTNLQEDKQLPVEQPVAQENTVVDPAQRQQVEQQNQVDPFEAARLEAEQRVTQQELPQTVNQNNDALSKALSTMPSATGQVVPSGTVPIAAPTTATPPNPSGSSWLDKLGTGASDLAKALGTTPAGLAKTGILATGALQANDNSKKMQETATANEAAIKALSDPYRQQGAELLAAGRAGQLTGPQQQKLEAVRAQMAQAASNAGQTGGTGQQQIDATIARMSQQFATDNINEGMKLMQVGDSYIQEAIKTGYLQNKDAMALSADFYKYLANAIPGLAVETDPATGQPKVKP